ncbi:LamG-like jellyroll fold domain-containing protein [Promicromonospora sp. NPDC059942]|uniref:LamG-like jellyroll fold domain-containing protein n=1 Tax=Promicromonospora sp. NPDC059942 TaxID=3347009 RepID=UPI003664984B
MSLARSHRSPSSAHPAPADAPPRAGRRPTRQASRRTRRRLGAAFAALATSAVLAVVPGTAAPAATPEASPAAGQATWPVTDAHLPTPWTQDVTPDNALPEYPRPQLTRDRWENLNGLWEFAGAAEGEAPPFGETLAEEILVPYPTESELSGVDRHEDHMWYRRTVEVPASWRTGGQRVVLNFGAVDHTATVWVNGQEVAHHEGGYGRFSADVTDALTASGPQEVLVGVADRTDATWQPVGKQRNVPDRGIFYEGASGIWQTVWMEPVAASHATRLDMTTDVDTSTLTLTVEGSAPADGRQVDVVVRASSTKGSAVAKGKAGKGKAVAQAAGTVGDAISVRVPRAHLWTPDDPYLYDLEVRVRDARGKVVDTVGSYFGMREIGIAPGADGRNRVTLNGEVVFLLSTLDQGYWPDGIYTAPTDEALAFDLEQHKELGFNTVRKHIKVEPDRWFYHADRLGLLVWQDMPAMKPGRPPVEAQERFERELHEMVDQNSSWTSVIGWVPFNEGWGEWSQEATGRIAREVKAQDPTRLVDAHSGVNCCDSLGDSGAGDVIDWHQYVGPAQPVPDATRASIDGEHGGFGLEVDGHMWFEDGHAYEMTPDVATLTRRYVENQEDVLTAAQQCGISGSIYTQITDVEHEVNGFFTYDRQVEKMDFGQVRAVNDSIIEGADGSGAEPPVVDPGTPGLAGVHAWGLDEGAGTVAADGVGDADATLAGTTWTDGVTGGALSFDGAGEADTGRTLVRTDGSYSVSAWARLDVADGGFQTVVSQDTGGNSAFFLQYSGQDQRWAMSFVGARALSPTKPEPGRWYHLTGVRDAATGELSLYVDGERVATRNVCTAPETQGSLVIGRGQYGGNEVDHLRGDVDDVRVFDRALTAEEVAQLAAG